MVAAQPGCRDVKGRPATTAPPSAPRPPVRPYSLALSGAAGFVGAVCVLLGVTQAGSPFVLEVSGGVVLRRRRLVGVEERHVPGHNARVRGRRSDARIMVRDRPHAASTPRYPAGTRGRYRSRLGLACPRHATTVQPRCLQLCGAGRDDHPGFQPLRPRAERARIWADPRPGGSSVASCPTPRTGPRGSVSRAASSVWRGTTFWPRSWGFGRSPSSAWRSLRGGFARWPVPSGRDEAVAVALAVLNPLVLLVLLGGAHNDALMLGLLVAGCALARRGHVVIGLAFSALAGEVKIPALIGVVLIGWWWSDAAPCWPQRIPRMATRTGDRRPA